MSSVELKVMLDNYPTAEEQQKSLVKSPQMVRAPKITLRVDDNGQRMQRQPRIIILGEVLEPYVLAPHEVDFNAYSSLSDEDSEADEEEEEIPAYLPLGRRSRPYGQDKRAHHLSSEPREGQTGVLRRLCRIPMRKLTQ
ncbi:hypothetical protein F4821DRAFT_281543 [Hypoxylon rubiginosum]|uniref:Uncharacterized protein n=1 Tax=Hypoxylon rubiginosum TaxID=110542 RepID=A0ACC0CQE1_9PEZI|nr:hypothetical protein F4821DRAFT_281543 [Hypoxylon rubiginosum]